MNCELSDGIEYKSFCNNLLTEIKINENVFVSYSDQDLYDDYPWTKFQYYYNNTGQHAGVYEYNNKVNEWEMFPL